MFVKRENVSSIPEMNMLRKSSFHGHYCLNTANVWKILSQNTCTWSLHTGSWICKSRKLQNYRCETENGWACYCEWTAQVVQTSWLASTITQCEISGSQKPSAVFSVFASCWLSTARQGVRVGEEKLEFWPHSTNLHNCPFSFSLPPIGPSLER